MRPQSVSRTTTGTNDIPLDINNVTATLCYQVIVSGTSATVDVQASLDGTNWEDLDAGLTAGKLAGLSYVPKFMRLNVSAISAATVTLIVIQNG